MPARRGEKIKKLRLSLCIPPALHYFCPLSTRETMTKRGKTYLYVAAACLLAVAALTCFFLFWPLSAKDSVRYVYIDADDTADSVYHKMDTIAGAGQLMGLKTMAWHIGYAGKVRTGRYAVRPGESAVTVLRRLAGGRQDPVNITIPEARTMRRLAGTLSRRLMADSASIASALTDSAFCAALGCDTATVPALFVPNTYSVWWDVSVENFMRRMKEEHEAFWTAERRAKADSAGLTLFEVATLASIVDEETADNAEKPVIAGLYINRLAADMPLQADPTVKFACGDFSLRRIYTKMTRVDSPYNTYANTGLPPGPIKIASVAGIDAVLDYARHDYIYMCAKEDFSGRHNFAATYKEHLRNAARYSKALDERGVK